MLSFLSNYNQDENLRRKK